MKSLTDTFALNNGVKIPCVGFGTWQSSGKDAYTSVKEALAVGYRHIDAAAAYGNEKQVGRAIAESGLAREDFFLTSKLWNTEHGYDKTLRAFDRTISDLGVSYLDLYLIHWPIPKAFRKNWQEANRESWKAFERLYKDGKIRSIGVSNFLPHHLEPLMQHAEIKPAVNQMEFHPGVMQAETMEYCRKHDIQMEAYSPLGTGRVLGNETLQSIAAKYGKSVAQFCIRWVLQNGVLPLPKSVTPSRIHENAQVFDFTISSEDMDTVNSMGTFGASGLDPDNIRF